MKQSSDTFSPQQWTDFDEIRYEQSMSPKTRHRLLLSRKMDSSRGIATSLRAAASIEYLFVVWRNTTRTSTRTSFCFRFHHRFQIISLLCSVTICNFMLMLLVKFVVIMFIFLTIVSRSPKFVLNKYICRFILLSNHVYCRHAIVLVPPVSENISFVLSDECC